MVFPPDADNNPDPTPDSEPLARRLRRAVEEKKKAEERARSMAFVTAARALWQGVLQDIESAAQRQEHRACVRFPRDNAPSPELFKTLFVRLAAEELAWEPPRLARNPYVGAMELWVSWNEDLKPGEHPQGTIYMGEPR